MVASLVLFLAACAPEHEITEIRLDAIAVTAGDFDRMEEGLIRDLVSYQLFDGYISAPVYDETLDPSDMVLKVEGLLPDHEELSNFGALFVNSGTRGLGMYVYNGVEADSAFLTDETSITNVRAFTEGGGVLVVSDWAYDLVEACWPDRVEFEGDDTIFDDAQRGTRGNVSASVPVQKLSDALGTDALSVTYDYSYWAVIDAVSSDTQVYLKGDVAYRMNESEGEGTLEDVPLLVGFTAGSGKVLYSTFNWRTQNPTVADTILNTLVGGLKGEAADTGDTGA